MIHEQLVDHIRAAVAEEASGEQKLAGAQACRTILAALEAETGKAIMLAGAPTPGPLAGIPPDQALDLLIARLSAIVPKEPSETAPTKSTMAAPLRIAFVPTPPRTRHVVRVPSRRKP